MGDRISNKLQVLRQRPDITWYALQKNEQLAQICIDEDGYWFEKSITKNLLTEFAVIGVLKFVMWEIPKKFQIFNRMNSKRNYLLSNDNRLHLLHCTKNEVYHQGFLQ